MWQWPSYHNLYCMFPNYLYTLYYLVIFSLIIPWRFLARKGRWNLSCNRIVKSGGQSSIIIPWDGTGWSVCKEAGYYIHACATFHHLDFFIRHRLQITLLLLILLYFFAVWSTGNFYDVPNNLDCPKRNKKERCFPVCNIIRLNVTRELHKRTL